MNITFLIGNGFDRNLGLATSYSEFVKVYKNTFAHSDNLLNFLELEMQRCGEKQLPPVQTGFGNLASEIVYGLGRSNFNNIEFFCGGNQQYAVGPV